MSIRLLFKNENFCSLIYRVEKVFENKRRCKKMSCPSFFHDLRMVMGKISIAIAILLTLFAINVPMTNSY